MEGNFCLWEKRIKGKMPSLNRERMDTLNKLKIVLCVISENRSYTPLALYYLRAVLLNNSSLQDRMRIEILEFDTKQKTEDIYLKIVEHQPDILGFSCFVWGIQKILAVTQVVKESHPKTTVVLGGPEVSPVANSVIEKNGQIDIVVRDEGEFTFLELVKSFFNDQMNLHLIPGISFRAQDRVIENPSRGIIEDLDTVPSAYLSNPFSLEDRDVCLETQRGCVFKCTFCYYGKGVQTGGRFFSLERIKDELSFLLRQNPKCIYLMDPVFNLPVERAKDICRFIIQNNKNRIPFHTEIRAELVDDELAELMYEAHIRHVEVGLQTSDPKVLNTIKRGLNTHRFLKGLGALKKYDIAIYLQLIYGLPKDSRETFLNSLEFALSLNVPTVEVFRLQVLPGTPIWREAKSLGITYDEKPLYWILSSQEFSADTLAELEKISFSIPLFNNNLLIELLCKEANIKVTDLMAQWVIWCAAEGVAITAHNSQTLWDHFKDFVFGFCRQQSIHCEFYKKIFDRKNEFPLTARWEKQEFASNRSGY